MSTRNSRFSQEIFGSVFLCLSQAWTSRACYDSDVPFALMHVCVAEYNALLHGEMTAEEKAQVMGGNLLRLLGVPR